MPFLNGQVSFTRLAITSSNGGKGPSLVGEPQLDALASGVLVPGEIGFKDEVETGWCAGAHVYDERFSVDHNTYAGGSVLHAAMRLDTNRVPGEIKRAIKGQLETSMRGADGTISRADRRDLRDLVDQSMHKELASGKHRSSSMTPILWDAERSVLLLASSANKATEAIADLWRTTFDGALQLATCSAGRLAYEHFALMGRTRDAEDIIPSPFTAPPPHVGEDAGRTPVVPWSAGSPEPHDFLGNELIVWLWYRWETTDASVEVTLPNGGTSELTLALDRVVDMQCAWGVTGKQTLRGDAEGPSPLRLPEAADALASGKWPRKVGLLLADDEGSSWRCTLQGDRWAVSAVALPDPPEDMEDEREKLEWRVDRTRALDERLLALFHAFLDERSSPNWITTRERISAWIRERRPGAKPAQQVEPMPSEQFQSV